MSASSADIAAHVKALTWGETGAAQEAAAKALEELSRDDANKVAIVEAGGIKPLVMLVEQGYKEAAETLGNLAMKDDIAVKIAEADGIMPLMYLFQGEDKSAKKSAVAALAYMAGNDAVAVKIAQAGAVGPLAWEAYYGIRD